MSDNGNVVDTVPREVRILAEALSRLHGPSVIRNESNGYHIYLPCPKCLNEDGRKELQSRHLTVNASRYKQLDDWLGKHEALNEDYVKDFSAVCHKTHGSFRVQDLLNGKLYPTLEARGIKGVNNNVTSASVQRTECLVPDENGNMIPQDAGEVVPITSLPPNHPAVQYLLNRNYDLKSLEKQFNCGYCVAEAPVNPSKGIFYRRLPMGFRDTSQGRIIFYSYYNNVRVGWQARILDRINEEGIREYWHPYNNIWVPVEYKNSDTGKWEPLDGVECSDENLWKPSKYKTAFGMARNEYLMGMDAAIQFNKDMGLKKSCAFIVEGPLDAGRIGPGACAMLGKYLSDKQADLLVRKFKRLIMVMDNDKAGKEAKDRIKKVMSGKNIDIIFATIPDKYKDVGEMTSLDAMTLVYQYIK